MKIKELIEQLLEHNQDLEVVIADTDIIPTLLEDRNKEVPTLLITKGSDSKKIWISSYNVSDLKLIRVGN